MTTNQEAKVFLQNHSELGCNIPAGVCLLCYRGSIAHGMYVPKEDPNSIDDIDLMGFVLGEDHHYLGLREWGSRGTKEIKEGQYDCVYYDIKKAVSLLLQGNPNVLGMLWTLPEHVIYRDDAGTKLIENRGLFVGRHVYNAFAGYAHAQMEKMETRDPDELREYMAVTAEMKHRGIHPNHKGEKFPIPDRSTGIAKSVSVWGEEGLRMRLAHYQKKGENIGYMGEKRKSLVLEHGYDSKNAAHLIRLLRMCVEFMDTGELQVYRADDRDELLSIKRGEWPLTKVKELAAELFEEARWARDRSTLPEGPDREQVEELLVGILRKHLDCLVRVAYGG